MTMRGLGEIPNEPSNGILTSMAYTTQNSNVDVMIIGTKSINHLRTNLNMINQDLPIDENVIDEFNNEKIIHESEKYLDYHFKKGLESLDDIQNSKIKNILINISNYLINRSN